MKRIFNFNAGPSAIDLSVLEQAKAEFTDFCDAGYSICEMSHRNKRFEEILNTAIADLKALYTINNDYFVIFMQGGASLQFAQIPMNLYKGGVAQYVDTGTWTQNAIKEAKIQQINYEIVASSQDCAYNYIPSDIKFSPNADYAYICSNNTIHGTQYKSLPKTQCPLVVDSSSDFLSREIDFKNIGFFYAGAQKNAGVAGVTIAIIRKDLVYLAKQNVPFILRYSTFVDKNSLYNTPNTFGIYIFSLVLKWIKKQGGLAKISEKNSKKAEILYNTIDEFEGFYLPFARKDSRSMMNVTFNIKGGEEIEKLFVKQAEENDMIGLKGHRSLGGIRASIYNALNLEATQNLCEFMREFVRKFG